MAADLNGHVAPVGIQDVKGIMIHIRHGPPSVPNDVVFHSHSLPIPELALSSPGSETRPE
jgi:hypothetical protein